MRQVLLPHLRRARIVPLGRLAMVVCAYCKSTLVKDADSVKSIGKMSEVLEDHSPIQINTSGTVDGRSFTVVGRIQLR